MKKMFENKWINLIASMELVAGILAFVFSELAYNEASNVLLGIFVIGMAISLTIWYGVIGNSFMGRKDNPKKKKSNLLLLPNLTVNIITLIFMLITFI